MDGGLAVEGFTAIGWSLEVQAICDAMQYGFNRRQKPDRKAPPQAGAKKSRTGL